MVKNVESYKNMWKAIISLVCVDGEITNEERSWVDEFINKAHLTPEEKEELAQEFHNPGDPFVHIENIKHPAHLSQLHHLANILFQSDYFDYREQVYLEKIQKFIESKIDLLSATRKSADYLKDFEEKTKKEKSQVKGLFLTLVEYFRD